MLCELSLLMWAQIIDKLCDPISWSDKRDPLIELAKSNGQINGLEDEIYYYIWLCIIHSDVKSNFSSEELQLWDNTDLYLSSAYPLNIDVDFLEDNVNRFIVVLTNLQCACDPPTSAMASSFIRDRLESIFSHSLSGNAVNPLGFSSLITSKSNSFSDTSFPGMSLKASLGGFLLGRCLAFLLKQLISRPTVSIRFIPLLLRMSCWPSAVDACRRCVFLLCTSLPPSDLRIAKLEMLELLQSCHPLRSIVPLDEHIYDHVDACIALAIKIDSVRLGNDGRKAALFALSTCHSQMKKSHGYIPLIARKLCILFEYLGGASRGVEIQIMDIVLELLEAPIGNSVRAGQVLLDSICVHCPDLIKIHAYDILVRLVTVAGIVGNVVPEGILRQDGLTVDELRIIVGKIILAGGVAAESARVQLINTGKLSSNEAGDFIVKFLIDTVELNLQHMD